MKNSYNPYSPNVNRKTMSSVGSTGSAIYRRGSPAKSNAGSVTSSPRRASPVKRIRRRASPRGSPKKKTIIRKKK